MGHITVLWKTDFIEEEQMFFSKLMPIFYIATNIYADLDIDLATSELSPYQKIRNTEVDNASTKHDSDNNTYEGLDVTERESGANTYET
ncbi:hypothetical protein KUTeg_014754 [Tegillarca granosa]|uniref:Uncharacterized protein n=1 Tax=Tegillarca granosa TaxID=220873 RepID=A0ABQ9ER43_TEGGR|nr:hypothetical protein KUTeg_014754 [Tegillarca granosa]